MAKKSSKIEAIHGLLRGLPDNVLENKGNPMRLSWVAGNGLYLNKPYTEACPYCTSPGDERRIASPPIA